MYPAGHEPLKGSLEDRYYEVKHLLAKEMTPSEIADFLGVHRKYVYEFIERHDYSCFVQPGSRKTTWRKECALKVKTAPHSKEFNDTATTLIEAFSKAAFSELRSLGLYIPLEAVQSEVNLSFTKAVQTYDEKNPAQFRSYFHAIVLNDLKNLKAKACGEIRKTQAEDLSKVRDEQAAAEVDSEG